MLGLKCWSVHCLRFPHSRDQSYNHRLPGICSFIIHYFPTGRNYHINKIYPQKSLTEVFFTLNGFQLDLEIFICTLSKHRFLFIIISVLVLYTNRNTKPGYCLPEKSARTQKKEKKENPHSGGVSIFFYPGSIRGPPVPPGATPQRRR